MILKSGSPLFVVLLILVIMVTMLAGAFLGWLWHKKVSSRTMKVDRKRQQLITTQRNITGRIANAMEKWNQE